MALGSEVVDLIRTHIIEQCGERTGVGKVCVVEKESGIGLVNILIDVIETVGVEAGGAPLQTMDFIPLFEEKLSEVRSILAGATGN